MSKIKLDYTTNSSSSSFVCFGVSKDRIKIANEQYMKIFDEYVSENKKWIDLTDNEISEMTNDDKIDYINNEIDSKYLYETDIISLGGENSDEVGITPNIFISKFPDEKIGNIKKITAEELNKKFGTNFTEKNICYFESGWYNG